MTANASAPFDPINHALDVTRRRLHRRALLRLALYLWFALMSVTAFVLVGREWSLHGTAALVTVWPAVLLQLVAVITLGWLLLRQLATVAELRARARSVRGATLLQLRVVQRDRRQSLALTGIAVFAIPALVYAVMRLVAVGAVAGDQSIWLATFCLLPSVVIAGVHIPRLLQLRRTRRTLLSTLNELGEES